MAELKDVVPVLRQVGVIRFCKRVYEEVNDDNCFGWASALAYSWLFAVFPFFIFLMTLTPYLPATAKQNARKYIHDSLSFLPEEALNTVWSSLDEVLAHPRGGLLSIGLLLTLWGASGGMAMTMQALDRAYDVTQFRSFFKQRIVAIMLTAIVTSLILLVLILLPFGTLAMRWLETHWSQWNLPLATLVSIQIARYLFALVLMIFSLALTYHFGTNVKKRFVILTPGSIFCVTVWILLGVFFRVYVNIGSYSRTYGAVGGVVVLLMFFYFDALVLLIGAEINAEFDAAITGRRNDGTVPDQAGEDPQVT